MYLSRWWREYRFEKAYRKTVRRDLEQLGREYKARFTDAKNGNDFDATLAAYLTACKLSDLRLETIKSRRLRKKAEQIGLEVPREWWEHDQTHDLWYLSPTGRRQLQKRITQERIWTLKQWFTAIVPIFAMVTGLIGIIIGLLAVWRAH